MAVAAIRTSSQGTLVAIALIAVANWWHLSEAVIYARQRCAATGESDGVTEEDRVS